MTGRKDHYYNKAKQEGYRTRAAYKLQQIDNEEHIFEEGDTVVDLGAAPGGWLQVAGERVSDSGTVIGVDFQRIKSLDDGERAVPARVKMVRGDMTDEETQAEVREVAGEEGVDAVISDMAPNMTGEYSVDHARSVYLAQQAFETAKTILKPGGDFAVKVFEGRDLADFKSDLEEHFEYVRTMRPDASRDESSEVYLVAKKYVTSPVSIGDTLTVEIKDVGAEGDGIARVEGYTIFVPDAERGETVEVTVTDVKARFGFAERVD